VAERDQAAGARPREGASGGVGERVRSIVEAAEDAAAAIRQQAEQQAIEVREAAAAEAADLLENAKAERDRYLEEARRRADAVAAERTTPMSELGDSLIVRAEALSARLDHAAELRRQLDGLMQAIAGTAERLAREAVASPDKDQPAGEGRAAAPDSGERASMRAVEAPSVQTSGLEDARLVTLQMALAGRSRADVESHVGRSFDVPEPKALVHEVFASLASGPPPAASTTT